MAHGSLLIPTNANRFKFFYLTETDLINLFLVNKPLNNVNKQAQKLIIDTIGKEIR